jgi:hypothetical protein
MKTCRLLVSLLFFLLTVGMLIPTGAWYGSPIPVGPGTDSSYCVALGDLDKDGNTDITVGNFGGQNVAYFGDGDGTFDTRSLNFGTGNDFTRILVLCDVNNDTWIDIVVGNGQAVQNIIYMNDGDGTFDSTSYNFGTGSDYTSALAYGDVNGDTLVDLAVGNLSQQNYIYLNDGTGNPFDTPANTIPFGDTGPLYDETWDLVFAYIDTDSYLDLVEANHQSSNYVYLGDGAGNFGTAYSFGGINEQTHSIDVGYIDGDSYLDVTEGNYDGQNRVYLGNGTGSLGTSHDFGPVDNRTQALVLADVNGDTFLDVAVGDGGDTDIVNKMYLGNGDGTFGSSYNFGSADATWDLKVDEFNGDTLLDIVVANVGQNVVYLNTDVTLENIGTLFDTNTFFVAGDNAYCTDVLGSAKIAFGLSAGGASENPEGRTDVILTTAEHDAGNLIPVGGPAINPVADEFGIYFGITYQYVENVSFTIYADGYSLYLNLQNYPERDICIVYIGEENNRNIMLVWGYGWRGTYAGSAFMGDPDNWALYEGYHMLMIRWIDSNGDLLVQMDEITVEQEA